MEAQRPGEREQGDPGRGNMETWGEGTQRPGERKHGDLGKENRKTWEKEPDTLGENTETGKEERPTAGQAGTAGSKIGRQ